MPIVYANGRAIARKNAGGKARGFPDVCHSPPKPEKTGVPVAYRNTAYDQDLAQGSRTVFVQGQPVARRDISYFAKSTGNEAATRNFKQGAFSGTLTGRAYFYTWSMDVFVEGANVCRHRDLMTMNHPDD